MKLITKAVAGWSTTASGVPSCSILPSFSHAVGYARPHELDLYRSDSGGGLWATVRHVRVAGAVVKIEVVDGADNVVHVQLGREQYEGLHLAAGEKVYVTPKRMRVFTSDGLQVTSTLQIPVGYVSGASTSSCAQRSSGSSAVV